MAATQCLQLAQQLAHPGQVVACQQVQHDSSKGLMQVWDRVHNCEGQTTGA